MEQAHQLADATGGAFRFYPVERITIDWPDEPKQPEPEPLSPEVAEAVESFWRWLAEQDKAVSETAPHRRDRGRDCAAVRPAAGVSPHAVRRAVFRPRP